MKKTAALFTLLFGLGFAFPASAEALVTLRTTPEVRAAVIRLADVFDGVPKEIDCDIAIAPAPGKSVTYNVHVIAKLASRYNLDWKPQSIADKSVLTRAATWITPDMIRQAVTDKVRQPNAENSDSIEIDFDGKGVGVALPVESQAAFDLNGFTYDPQSRRFRSELIAQTGAGPVTQTVSGRVIVRREVPVLARRLEAGSVVGQSDLIWQKVPQERLTTDVLTDASQIIGREVRRIQPEGEVLRVHDLIPPRLVTRGSMVTMKVETPMLQITVQGRSLQDGAKGDVVRVTNLQSHRTVEGIVEASGVVRIGGARKVASAE